MAWYDRISRGIQRLFGGETTSGELPEPPQSEPSDYFPEPPPPPEPPDVPYFPDSGDDNPDYWDSRWVETGEPEWWNDNVTIYNDQFTPLTQTGEDWFNETIRPGPELLELYGIDNLDIIRQLMDRGLWERGEPGYPSADWAYWRELYES